MAVELQCGAKRVRMLVACVVLAVAMVVSGCQSRRVWIGGGVRPNVPLVTLESVTATNDSPSWGYPVFQFPRPWFPFEMLRANVAGEVVVRANVSADGIVQSVSVVRSTHREFEPYALGAVELWRFVEFVPPVQRSPHGYTVDCLIKFGFDES